MNQLTPASGPEDASAPGGHFIELAALLGAFNPQTFIARASQGESSHDELRELALNCDEVETEDELLWRLKPDPRRRTIAQLNSEHRLESVAADAAPLDSGLFGSMLRDALVGSAPIELPTAQAELDQARQALQFAAQESDVARRLLAEVELQLARNEREVALRVLVPRTLKGRDDELAELAEFVQRPGPRLEVKCVTGVGGAGKSALLAEFAARTQGNDWLGTPVVTLDFDRASLTRAGVVSLTMELTRQLELFFPEMREQFRKFRADMRELELSSYTRATTSSFEAEASIHSIMWSVWAGSVGHSLGAQRPVLLILDTFEEVLVRGGGETEYILNWLNSTSGEGGLSLKVLLSGRASPTEEQLPRDSHDDLVVRDLAPPAAAELLGQELSRLGARGVGQLPLRALVLKFGGHPLLLKVLARYLQQQDDPTQTARELLSAKEPGDGEFDRQFSQTFLYQRILSRIRSDDPAVEALAHPGLALRRVTPNLIKKVLAKPCGIKDVDEARARSLFEHLRRQVWLVEGTDQSDVLRHRKDLRRLMLQSMASDPQNRARRIHRRAALYYSFELDGVLSKGEQRLESLYHALMAQMRHWPTLDEVRPLLNHLGEDLQQLPIASRAKLKLEAEEPLQPDEVAVLNKAQRDVYEYRAQAQRNRRGSRAAITGTSASISDAFSTGELDAVLSLLPQTLDSVVSESILFAEPTDKDTRALTSQSAWQAAICIVASSEERTLGKDLLGALLNSKKLGSSRRGRMMVNMVAVLLGDRTGDLNYVAGASRSLPIDDLDVLRELALLSAVNAAVAPTTVNVPVEFLRDLEEHFIAAAVEDSGELSPNLSLRRSGKDKPRDVYNHPLVRNSRLTLVDLEMSRRRGWYVRARGWPSERSDRRLLNGCLPELYPAIRGTLQKLPLAVILDFAQEQSDSLDRWPVELAPAELNGGLKRDGARWLSTIIEVCDRRDELLRLMEFCHDNAPNRSVIKGVMQMYEAYSYRLIDPLEVRRR